MIKVIASKPHLPTYHQFQFTVRGHSRCSRCVPCAVLHTHACTRAHIRTRMHARACAHMRLMQLLFLALLRAATRTALQGNINNVCNSDFPTANANPFLVIDLGEPRNINRIKVYNRRVK